MDARKSLISLACSCCVSAMDRRRSSVRSSNCTCIGLSADKLLLDALLSGCDDRRPLHMPVSRQSRQAKTMNVCLSDTSKRTQQGSDGRA